MNEPRWRIAIDQLLRACPSRRRHLVGVSGGRDSVALLHLLFERADRKLIVCHLDHGLRGRAARDDARFVARLAASLKLPCVTERVDVAALATERGISVETAAREARHDFFARVGRRERVTTLFLAHHADDQVETFLFHLLRGAGPAGLAGMRPVSKRGALTLIRPLLAVWRRELDAWIEERGLRWREDASNTDDAHTRNRIRLSLLPALARELGREVKPAIWRAADLLGAEEEWMQSTLHSEINALPVELRVKSICVAPLAKQRRLLRAWLEQRGISAGYAEVEAVRSLLDPDAEGHPAKINLPFDRHVRRRAGRIWLE